MAKQKKPVHRVEMTEGKRNIIRQLLEEYDIETAEDIQDALKDLLGGTIKEMMEAEMDDHLGYEKSQRSDNDDYRNGYKRKQVNSRYGSMEIEVPQDRKSTFEPQVVKKRQKDISDIDQKIISMYAKNNIGCKLTNDSIIPHRIVDRIDVKDWIYLIQWAVLPIFNLRKYLIRHIGYETF